MDKTDKELIIMKAVEFAKIEQEIRAKGERTALDEDKLLAIAFMSGHIKKIKDEYEKLIEQIRKEQQQ